MKRQSRIAVALFAGASLILAACGGDDGGDTTEAPTSEAPTSEAPSTDAPAEEPTASDVGVTETTISIGVAVADLEAVRAVMPGVVPETLTTDHLFDRWKVFADDINEAGGINGRTIELVRLVWNPLDQTSFDALCAEATIDNELFAMVNGTGLSSIARDCIYEGGVPILYGDVMTEAELATGLAISLVPPTEVMAAAGAKQWIENTDAAAGSTVGIMSNNTPGGTAAGDAAQAALEEAGFVVTRAELNSVSGDNAAINEEGAVAVGNFVAEGAVHVLVATPFTENTGFWTKAAEADLSFTLLDVSSSGCSPFGLSADRAATAVGSSCTTAFDHSTDGTSIRPDSDFEAACRANFDENFTEYYGGPSNPGVPAGRQLTDTAGTVLNSDYTPQECSISNIIKLGLEAAGVNPTRASFIEAILGLGDVPLALIGGGTGTFAPGKPFAANAVHVVKVTAANAQTAPDANGLYNGCAAPVNCGVITSDWTPIAD
ncbi:MAG: ABC transporter substrate-binding protein [Ilumatobacteraceae bacterium]|jgi:ABC-type branched-subunit amino acid transport system substrate-binding protein|nr:ABC transporter substrate-binding protein [Ilumatobacteraceae bacterium]